MNEKITPALNNVPETMLLTLYARALYSKKKNGVCGLDTGFRFGADSFSDISTLADGYENIFDDNIIRGLKALHPIYRLIGRMPHMKNNSQKILVFRKSRPGALRAMQ